jgi:D-alanyl-D-alanine carboxypeptidase
MRKTAVATIACLLLFSFITVSGQRTVSKTKIDQFIKDKMQEYGIPGLSLAVVRDGKIIHLKGYGIANLELSAPVTEKTVFSLASITKTFTAILTMALVEDGRLSLDDPLSKHLNGLPEIWKPITVRQLLTHTSGIPSFATLDKEPCPVGKQFRDYTREDVLKEVSCFPLEFAPGERFAYGDTNYHLLGMIVERVSGKSYETFLHERVLDPLGMKDTRNTNYFDLIPNRASGYSLRNGIVKNANRFEIDEFANGSLISTAVDMAKFERAFTTEKVLKRKTLEQMWTNAKLNDGKTVEQYGLGLGLTPFLGRKRIGHNGGGGLGFATSFTYFPAEKISVVVLSNADQPGGRIGDLANEIAALYF